MYIQYKCSNIAIKFNKTYLLQLNHDNSLLPLNVLLKIHFNSFYLTSLHNYLILNEMDCL